MLAIIGESGSGKSVSSRALMGLLPPTAQVSGSARFDGRELLGLPEQEMRRCRGADIAMVFQDPARSLNPTMRIGVQITEAIRAHADLDRERARRRGRWSCCSWSGCPPPSGGSTSTRTSSPAACASA